VCVSLDHFIFVLSAFIVLGLVSSVRSQEIGWKECLQNDLFSFEWDVKLNKSSLVFYYLHMCLDFKC